MKTHKNHSSFLQDVVVGMTQAGLLVGGGLAAGLLAVALLGSGLK